MNKFKAAVFSTISAVCILSLVQSGTGKTEIAGTKTLRAEVPVKADITGTWKGNGVDTRGVTWEFTFTLTQKNDVLEGKSAWKGSDGSSAIGTMKGTINLATNTFILNDTDLSQAVGDVLAATYTGSLSADFKKMTGKWTIPNGGSPGTFEAAKMK